MKYLARKMLLGIIGGIVLFSSSVVFAGKFTVPADITYLRSYVNGSYFVGVNTPALSGGGNCTTVYKVNSLQAGAKTIIATLLTARSLDSKVSIEIDNTGCKGWGTLITSVILM